jgi:hypothetical protein
MRGQETSARIEMPVLCRTGILRARPWSEPIAAANLVLSHQTSTTADLPVRQSALPWIGLLLSVSHVAGDLRQMRQHASSRLPIVSRRRSAAGILERICRPDGLRAVAPLPRPEAAWLPAHASAPRAARLVQGGAATGIVLAGQSGSKALFRLRLLERATRPEVGPDPTASMPW